MGVGGGGQRRGEEARGEERREHHFKAHQRSTLPGARPGGQGFLRALAVVLTCNHTNDSGQSIARELKHDSMFGSKVASCPWCSAVCPRATTTMRRTAPLPSSPSPPHLSHLAAQVSFLRLHLLHSLIHSFLHSFIHSFIRRAQEGAGFSQPAPIRRSEGEQPPTATEKCLPLPIRLPRSREKQETRVAHRRRPPHSPA